MKKVHKLSGFGLKSVAISFLSAFFITVIIAALLAVLFALTPISEKVCNAVSGCLSGFSAFLAALFTAFAAKKNGLVTGMVSSFSYTLILVFVATVFFPAATWQIFLKKLFLNTALGAVGGIIGVNLGVGRE